MLGLRDAAGRVQFSETASVHLVIEKKWSKTLLGILGPHTPCMCPVMASWLWQGASPCSRGDQGQARLHHISQQDPFS